MGRVSLSLLLAMTVAAVLGCKNPAAPAAQKEATGSPQVSQGNFFEAPTSTIEDPKAKEVVEAMYAAYAACDTYADTGTVTMDDAEVSFETRFKRPYGFYFEFTSRGGPLDSGRHVLWTHGDRTQYIGETFGQKYEEDSVLTDVWPEIPMLGSKDLPLGLSISGFTGISIRAAHTVPRMLFPVSCSFGMNYAVYSDLVLEGSQTDRGVKCDVLYSQEWGERIWIDQTTRLLRRVDVEMTMGDFDFFTKTLYSPKVNGEIADSDLTFVPPG